MHPCDPVANSKLPIPIKARSCARLHHHPRHSVFRAGGGAKLENRRGGAGDHHPEPQRQTDQRREVIPAPRRPRLRPRPHRRGGGQDRIGHLQTLRRANRMALCDTTRPRIQRLDRRALRRRCGIAVPEREVLRQIGYGCGSRAGCPRYGAAFMPSPATRP